ncbi:MAG TPA: universal stress protein [Nitrososphaeraceae archaeon]|nr:universal stress protein [Nitrososphaeraceae archaeon]
MKTNINNDDANKVSEHDNSKISKILVPIDGSELSRKAADYAIFLSSKLGTELCVIHVIDNVPYEHNVGSYGLYDIETPDEIKQILEEERGITKEWFDRIKVEANEEDIQVIRTDLVTTRSSIESAIIDYAERNRVDLIIIGTTGHSGFKKLVFGNVASGVIKHSHCPVMMIK